MIVDTKYGQYECNDITRKKRRELYKKVKAIYATESVEEIEAEDKLGNLTALEEDEVLMTIINSYMGVKDPLKTGD